MKLHAQATTDRRRNRGHWTQETMKAGREVELPSWESARDTHMG